MRMTPRVILELQNLYPLSSLKQSPKKCDMLTAQFQTDEVLKGIKSLKMGKAVAADLINNEILKATGDIIALFLVALFNKFLDLEKFPEDWSTVIEG